MVPAPPGNFGQRLLPCTIDEIARENPSRVLYSVAKTKNIADGFQDIDARSFALAVDRCAWYLEGTLGRGEDFPTLLYMGPQDVVYAILIVACIKTGYQLLLSSPRNTLEAHVSLLEKTRCSTMLLPPMFPLPVIKQIQAVREMKAVEILGAHHWLTGSEPVPYLYTKTYDEAKLDPWVILHTSGSTGTPKPIIQAHATYSALDAFTALPLLKLQDTYPALCKGRRLYLGFPLFHCAGVTMLLPASIFAGFTVVLGPFPPSAETINAIHLHANVQESCIAPITLIDLSKDSGYLENLRRLEQITYGGGSLPQAVGNLVSARTRLVNVLGTTEAGVLPHHLCDPEDWAYMSLSPALGHEYRPISEDLYELFIVRSPDPGLQLYQGIFGTFPELKEWSTRDLYSKHPAKDNVWLYRGRNDDIIVFSTGEKLNPVDMESIIQAHPAVTGVVVCGVGRFQSSLLIEAINAPADETEREKLIGHVWPAVDNANRQSPSHGRIHRDMIILTSPQKPMLRAGKGSVQRQATVNLYAAELDAVYAQSEIATTAVQRNYTDVADAVTQILSAVSDIDIAKTSSHSDLFEMGLDSLQAQVITKEINKYLVGQGKRPKMEVRFVYSNPSVTGLVATLKELVDGKLPKQKSPDSLVGSMQKVYQLHASDFPVSARAPRQSHNEVVVLLTGSTGSLGSYILDSLISETRVTQVYCLNRGPDSLGRQRKSQSAKNLHQPTDKISCLDADLSREFFGLPIDMYKTLLRETTHIIHNAWQVDFMLTFDSFAGHLGTVRRFIDFSAHSSAGAQVFFISSISAVANYNNATIPEVILDDWNTPHEVGYGQSKFVAERILDAAARVAGVPATVCRVGQIAGPSTSTGIWPKQEWFPSLVASSRYLGKLPASLGRLDIVDWIPVDILGRALVELTVSELGAGRPWVPGMGATVYHAVNPQRTIWTELVEPLSRSLSAGCENMEVVSLECWLDTLRRSASEEVNLISNPATKILDFYEGLQTGKKAHLDTKETLRSSPTLASLVAVHEAWMENWVKQWSF